MSRAAFFLAFLMLASVAQAQLFSAAPPASATSPTADGRTHGAPASVVSPKVPPFVPGHVPRFVQSAPLRPFGHGHHRDRDRNVFIPVPLFYPVYGPGFDNGYLSPADPAVPDPNDPAATDDVSVTDSEDALRQAYLQGVRDAISQQSSSRYGQHYMDSRESARGKNSAPAATSPSSTASAPKGDPKPEATNDMPPAVFIFKDGHEIETRNYAIMGQTLYDFSSPSLKKVQLADLDKAATVKANDDRGIIVKLP